MAKVGRASFSEVIAISTFELYDLKELEKPIIESSSDDQIQKLIDQRMELHSLVNKVVEDKISQREALHKLMMSKLNEVLVEHKNTSQHIVPVTTEIKNPIDLQEKDIVKKEKIKKGSPLKDFLERKKKPKEYHVEISKSETVNCPDCFHTIYGEGVFSGCICLGEDQNKKLWIKKNYNGIQVKFSKSWDPENIEMLLETLRKARK